MHISLDGSAPAWKSSAPLKIHKPLFDKGYAIDV